MFKKVLLMIVVIAVFTACDKKKEDPSQSLMKKLFWQDDQFFYVTFSAKGWNYRKDLVLKIPKEYTSRVRPYSVRFRPIRLKLDEYDSLVFQKVRDLKSTKPIHIERDAALRVYLSSPGLNLYYPKAATAMRLYSYVGETQHGLSHYKNRGCEGKPFDRSLINPPSFEYGCSSLRRSELYLSKALLDDRAVELKCALVCSATTPLHGFTLGYAFPVRYLERWQEIDSYVYNFASEFVVSHQKKNLSD